MPPNVLYLPWLMPNTMQKNLENTAARFAKVTADALAAQRVAILAQDENGVVTLLSHGFDGDAAHAQLNGLLSVGIHINLTDHDQHVLAGLAGSEAQNTAQKLRESIGAA
jgi:hypothetical protein